MFQELGSAVTEAVKSPDMPSAEYKGAGVTLTEAEGQQGAGDDKSKSSSLKGCLSVGKAGLVFPLWKNSELAIVPLPFVSVWGPQPWACAICPCLAGPISFTHFSRLQN